jgi:hypothetical protein
MHDDNIRSLLIHKESLSSQTFDAIKWHSSERALRRLTKNQQMNVVKLCHNYWHTSSRNVRFYGGEIPCCFCQDTKEDWRHILDCLSLDANYHRDASWQKVKKAMKMWKLLADFWTATEKGLRRLITDITQAGIACGRPFRNRTRSNGLTFSRVACPTGGSNLPPHTSGQRNSTYRHNNGAPNSSQYYGTILFEYGNSAMTLFTGTQTHKSNATN